MGGFLFLLQFFFFHLSLANIHSTKVEGRDFGLSFYLRISFVLQRKASLYSFLTHHFMKTRQAGFATIITIFFCCFQHDQSGSFALFLAVFELLKNAW